MRYDVADHPLLTDQAKQLDADSLEAHGRVAEQLLGLLSFPVFGDGTDSFLSAKDAVALQVSHQVEMGLDAHILASMARGGRTFNFRNSGRRSPPIVNAAARRLVYKIKPKTESPT